MYSVVTTSGLIIDSRPYGEAGKLLYIFTKEHGLVIATAQGIRLGKSKLRPFIQNYSFGQYSFVKGKEYWRLVGAENIKNQISNIKYSDAESRESGVQTNIKSKNKEDNLLELKAKISLLLKKMLHGEESNPDLFDVVFSVETVRRSDLIGLAESLIVLRMFHKLGYIGNIGELNSLLVSNELSDDILSIVSQNREFINKQINKAIKESHL